MLPDHRAEPRIWRPRCSEQVGLLDRMREKLTGRHAFARVIFRSRSAPSDQALSWLKRATTRWRASTLPIGDVDQSRDPADQQILFRVQHAIGIGHFPQHLDQMHALVRAASARKHRWYAHATAPSGPRVPRPPPATRRTRWAKDRTLRVSRCAITARSLASNWSSCRAASSSRTATDRRRSGLRLRFRGLQHAHQLIEQFRTPMGCVASPA